MTTLGSEGFVGSPRTPFRLGQTLRLRVVSRKLLLPVADERARPALWRPTVAIVFPRGVDAVPTVCDGESFSGSLEDQPRVLRHEESLPLP